MSSISGTLYLLFGAVTLLLAIGCGNVSILLLARGAVRQHELAVRAAVGAPRSRIVRQLLTESLLLAAIGALLGVLTSYGILAGIKVLLPRYAFAPEVVVRINLPVLFFSVAVALGTGVLFGWWPALRLSRTQVGQIMQSNARRVATLPCLATSNDLNQRLNSRSICRLLWGLCSVGRQRRGQRGGVENVLDSEDEVLPSVEFVGHRRRIHAAAGVQVPQGFARGRIESQ